MEKETKKIEIVGPPGRIVVKESELQRYLTKGYKLLDTINPEPEPAIDEDFDSDDIGD